MNFYERCSLIPDHKLTWLALFDKKKQVTQDIAKVRSSSKHGKNSVYGMRAVIHKFLIAYTGLWDFY